MEKYIDLMKEVQMRIHKCGDEYEMRDEFNKAIRIMQEVCSLLIDVGVKSRIELKIKSMIYTLDTDVRRMIKASNDTGRRKAAGIDYYDRAKRNVLFDIASALGYLKELPG